MPGDWYIPVFGISDTEYPSSNIGIHSLVKIPDNGRDMKRLVLKKVWDLDEVKMVWIKTEIVNQESWSEGAKWVTNSCSLKIISSSSCCF